MLDYIYLHLGHEYRYTKCCYVGDSVPPNAFKGSSKILLPVSTADAGSWAGWLFLDLEDGFTVGFVAPVEKISSVRGEQKAYTSKHF